MGTRLMEDIDPGVLFVDEFLEVFDDEVGGLVGGLAGHLLFMHFMLGVLT